MSKITTGLAQDASQLYPYGDSGRQRVNNCFEYSRCWTWCGWFTWIQCDNTVVCVYWQYGDATDVSCSLLYKNSKAIWLTADYTMDVTSVAKESGRDMLDYQQLVTRLFSAVIRPRPMLFLNLQFSQGSVAMYSSWGGTGSLYYRT